MKKKMISVLIMLMVLFSFSACSDDSVDSDVTATETGGNSSEAAVEMLVESALYEELSSEYSSADVANSKYEIGSVEEDDFGTTYVYGKVYLYDKYGDFYWDSISKNFDIKIEDNRVRSCNIS